MNDIFVMGYEKNLWVNNIFVMGYRVFGQDASDSFHTLFKNFNGASRLLSLDWKISIVDCLISPVDFLPSYM